jgi:hypothetical protein
MKGKIYFFPEKSKKGVLFLKKIEKKAPLFVLVFTL